MSAHTDPRPTLPTRQVALDTLATTAAEHIPGTDFVSITVRRQDEPPHTEAATDPLAERADRMQYDLREGPCYAAVTGQRFVVVNDLAAVREFPHYGPRAAELGIAAQAAIHLDHDGERAGLNLYATTPGAFDPLTVQYTELFAAQAGALIDYAEQVEQLGEALLTRTDIGTAVGILMERFSLDREQAFSFLARRSQEQNIKVRVLALQVIDGTFCG